MVGFQRDPWSLLPWTFLKFQTTQNLKWLFSLVLGNSPLCEVLEWAVAAPSPSRSPWVHISPLPASLTVKAWARPLAQSLDISHLDSESGTNETKAKGGDHSFATEWYQALEARVLTSRTFSATSEPAVICAPSLHQVLQPTAHSENLVCNGCPFLVFSCLSDFSFLEWEVIKRARGNFSCLQQRVFTGTQRTRPNGGTFALKSSRKKCSSKLVHKFHKPRRGFAFFPEYDCVRTDHSDQKKEMVWPQEIRYPAPTDLGNYW